jgi:alpha-L-rhamnosidase
MQIMLRQSKKAVIAAYGYENLTPQDGEPVRSVETLPIQSILITPKGETVLDVGQNIAGRLRMTLDLPKGASVTLEHSETLDRDGNYFNNIQGINQKDIYISNGTSAVYEPAFTFHGFRYVKLTGLKTVSIEDFTAVVLATDEPWIGSFSCSDPRINRLVENTRWSQRANMLSIPTDCPQREKAGWTGDMTVYCETAFQNQALTGLITRWLGSIALSQAPDGQVPQVVPQSDFFRSVTKLTQLLLGGNTISSSGWADAAVFVPWALYQATDNQIILKSQYPSMKKWVEYMRREASSKAPKDNPVVPETERFLWDTGFHFGEWLIPSCSQKGSLSQAVRKSVRDGARYIAPVFFYLSCQKLAKAASILNKPDDAAEYFNLAEQIKTACQQSIVLPDGKLKFDVQGAYVIVLGSGILSAGQREAAATRLAQLIHENGDRLDTGFLSTPFLLDALYDNGHAETAFSLLYQNRRPSWLYEVDCGATTIWENWNCRIEDGTVQTISMNHYAFGCVSDWIYRRIG